jgi:serine/threonine protein kinase
MMHCKNIIVADDFPLGFEPSNIQIPDGRRADFEKLGSSKFALVLRFNILFKAKVYSIVLKKYFIRNFSDCLKFIFRKTRAQRAYEAGQMLIENGFLTPPAVAHGKQFLMTMDVKDSTQLFKLLETLPPEKKKTMIEQFAKTIGKMHDKGIVHGDLRLGNVLVKSTIGHFERSEAESRNLLKEENFQFYFLDNERTRKYEQVPWKLRVKNLVQINMHRDNVDENDRKLFFDTYLAQQSKSIDAHKLSEEIILKTNKRLLKKN